MTDTHSASEQDNVQCIDSTTKKYTDYDLSLAVTAEVNKANRESAAATAEAKLAGELAVKDARLEEVKNAEKLADEYEHLTVVQRELLKNRRIQLETNPLAPDSVDVLDRKLQEQDERWIDAMGWTDLAHSGAYTQEDRKRYVKLLVESVTHNKKAAEQAAIADGKGEKS